MNTLKTELVSALRQVWTSPSTALMVVQLLVLGIVLNTVALNVTERLRVELPTNHELKQMSCVAWLEARTIRTVVVSALRKITGSQSESCMARRYAPDHEAKMERCNIGFRCRRISSVAMDMRRD
jgi:hypothetical protein